MTPLRIGVMGCSSFAHRAMLPALMQCKEAKLVCVASRSHEKAHAVAVEFECDAVVGYDNLLERDDLDAIYVPLPTGLHRDWCAKALTMGKHLLVEKSFTSDLKQGEELLAIAKVSNLLVMENFQFQTHSQWAWIKHYIDSGALGELHLIRSTFGFPALPVDNFRWNKGLGGGALLDAGAYVAKVCCLLMGDAVEVTGSSLWIDPVLGVDKYGEAMLQQRAAGLVAQVAFGFDYFYQCRLELLGTKGKLQAERVFTAPPGYAPVVTVEHQGERREYVLPPDNHYLNMWLWFVTECRRGQYESHWNALRIQASLLDGMRRASGQRVGM